MLEGEQATFAEAVIAAIAHDGAVVPSIFWYEVRNALIVNERRGRLGPEQSGCFLAWLAELGMAVEPPPEEGPVLELARRYDLTVYDAAYLELASRYGLRLATADRRLSKAAAQVGVALFVVSG